MKKGVWDDYSHESISFQDDVDLQEDGVDVPLLPPSYEESENNSSKHHGPSLNGESSNGPATSCLNDKRPSLLKKVKQSPR